MPEKDTREAKDQPSVAFLIYGELEQPDKELIIRLMGRLGVESEFTDYSKFVETMEQTTKLMSFTEAEHELKDEQRQLFSEISHPQQYIVREHLENFYEIYPSRLAKGFVGRVFNAIVDGPDKSKNGWQSDHRSNGNWRWRDVNPIAGIELQTREEAGFEPYEATLGTLGRNNLCASFAIRAGSIVAAAEHLGEVTSKTTKTEAGIVLIANQLSSQFKTTA